MLNLFIALAMRQEATAPVLPELDAYLSRQRSPGRSFATYIYDPTIVPDHLDDHELKKRLGIVAEQRTATADYWIWNSAGLLPSFAEEYNDYDGCVTNLFFALLPNLNPQQMQDVLNNGIKSSKLTVGQRRLVLGLIEDVGMTWSAEEHENFIAGQGQVTLGGNFAVQVSLPNGKSVAVWLPRGNGGMVPATSRSQKKSTVLPVRIPAQLANLLGKQQVILPATRGYFKPFDLIKLLSCHPTSDIRLESGYIYLQTRDRKLSGLELATIVANSTGMYFRPESSQWHLGPAPGDPRVLARQLLKDQIRNKGRTVLNQLEDAGFLPKGTQSDDFLRGSEVFAKLPDEVKQLVTDLLNQYMTPRDRADLKDYLTDQNIRAASKIWIYFSSASFIKIGSVSSGCGGMVGG